jgi:hypothetical protein
MAKTKYDPQTWPLLAEGYAREGLTDQQMMKKLGVSNGTFYKYVEQYPEFKEGLKRGKAPVDIQVENSLLKRALGYEYTETENKTRNGKTVEEKETVKQVVPDTTAQIFWLKNRKPDLWRDKQVLGHELEKMNESDLDKMIDRLFPDSTNRKKEDQ